MVDDDYASNKKIYQVIAVPADTTLTTVWYGEYTWGDAAREMYAELANHMFERQLASVYLCRSGIIVAQAKRD